MLVQGTGVMLKSSTTIENQLYNISTLAGLDTDVKVEPSKCESCSSTVHTCSIETRPTYFIPEDH